MSLDYLTTVWHLSHPPPSFAARRPRPRTTLVYGMLVAPLLLTILLTTHARCPRCRSTVVWLYLATGAHSVDLRCPHCGASLNEIR